ncbi:MAG: antitoxin component YwqK of YwqJK toxin-antitoxin module [Cyclobacteriaceae bacterium]|jgi:antitoxin component YwqK of YwqJK toxin-antitoxin module
MQFANNYILIVIASLFIDGAPKLTSTDTTLRSREVSVDSLTLNPMEGIVYAGSIPFTGTSIKHFPNNLISERITYLNGKREGQRQKWFANGGLSYKAIYQSNKLNGMASTWWYNGNLRSTSHFEKGIAHGLQKQWYVSGQVFKEQNLAFGKEKGIQKAWRKNGKIYVNYEAKNGRIFGLKRSNLCYELNDESIVYND